MLAFSSSGAAVARTAAVFALVALGAIDAKANAQDDQMYLKSKPNGELVIGNKGGTIIPCTLDSRFSECELDVWTTHFAKDPAAGAHLVYFQGEVVFSCFPQWNFVELRAEPVINGKAVGKISTLTSATLFRKIEFKKESGKLVVKIPLNDPKNTLFADLPSTQWSFSAREASNSLLTVGAHESLNDNEDTTGFSAHFKKFKQICGKFKK